MQTKKSAFAALAASTALVLALGACGSGSDSGSGGGSSEPVVLGTTLPLTGPLGIFGPPIQAGYEQAVAAINGAGGVDVGGTKRPLKLVVKDSKSDPTVVTSTAKSLINDDKAVALLGSVTPPLTIPFSVVADSEQIPAISPLTPTLAWKGANAGGWKYAYDVFVDETEQTLVNFKASDLVETNKKVALFTDTEEDGKAMGALWEQQAPAAGYTVVYRAEFPVGTTDFSQFVQKAKDSGAEVMIAQVIPPDAAALWKQMKSLGYAPKTAWPEKGGTVGFPDAAGPLAEGATVFGWWTPTNGNVGGQAVYDANKAKFGDGLGTQAVVASYAMVQVMADAITRAGSTDPDAINKALGATNGLDTVWAKITIGPDHRAVVPATAVQWQGKNQVTVWPKEQATGTFLAPAPGLAAQG
ncbi:ABC transporter substrate-binding protein [Kineosporia sp. R_H_3]|uniref:ABC transporter substrate-binding protein n=1 Tax=Kineosporia sp. R_H_3 TaxID=1961848 RepID=UPI000B4AEB85|nr:ABC transporter substrate-binding protein [Kineosporia sp. R_H_3]